MTSPRPFFDRDGLRYRQLRFHPDPGVLYRFYPSEPFEVDGIRYRRGIPRAMIELEDQSSCKPADCFVSTPMTEGELAHYTLTGIISPPTTCC